MARREQFTLVPVEPPGPLARLGRMAVQAAALPVRQAFSVAAWREIAVRSHTVGPLTLSSLEIQKALGGGPTTAGVPVSEQSALALAAVWDAVQVIAGATSSLPLIPYKRQKGGGKERMTWSRLYRLLHDEFNPEMTAMVARETMQAHVLLWGNAYAEIERAGSGEPIALWPLTPDRVRADRTRNGDLYYVVAGSGYSADPYRRSEATIAPANMLHIVGLSWDGTCGYSVIRKARESLGLSIAAERFGAEFFSRGARSGGVLEHPGKLSQTAHENLKKSLANLQAHEYAVIEEGMKLEKWTIPPDDAQFLTTRQFQVVDIARWFNIPVTKLKDLSRATYSNVEQEELSFVVGTLQPWLVRWEQEINRKLIPSLERRQQFVEHLVDGLLRGDLPSRYAAYAVGRQWGWLSADDVREKENMNPLPDGQGQVYLLPGNMVPADKADQIVPPGAAKPPVAPAVPAAPTPDMPTPQDEAASLRAMAESMMGTLRPDIERVETAIREAAAHGHPELAEAMTAALAGLRAEMQEAQGLLLRASEDSAGRIEAVRQEVVAAVAGLTPPPVREMPMPMAGEDESTFMDRCMGSETMQVEFPDQDQRLAVCASQWGDRSLEPVIVEGLSNLAVTIREESAAAEARQRAAQEALEARLTKTEAVLTETVASLREGAARTAERVQGRLRGLQVDAAQREQLRQTHAGTLAAHRHLIQDAMRRVLHREALGARKAAQSPEKLSGWIDTFYGRRQPMVDAVLPVMSMHVVLSRSTEPAAARAEALIAAHCQRSREELEAMLTTPPAPPADLPAAVERLMARWEQDRPGQAADELLKEVTAHVE